MQLEDQGLAFLPSGCGLPSGSYPVYSKLEISDDGAAVGEVHFMSEPRYPQPIALGRDFDLHVPHPDSILGDNVVLRVRFVDESGSVTGHVYGSLAQFPTKIARQSTKSEDSPMSSRNVFVIHGRDERLRKGMFDFLRSLDLNPMEWSQAVHLTGSGTPYVGEVLDAAFANAQAVVVLFTPDDLARLRPELCGTKEPDHETGMTPQARPNVLFEAGMAMAREPKRTIFVEIGQLRPFSDAGGRHMLRMDNSATKRNELATRLKTAGCPINLSGTDWHTAGDMIASEIGAEPIPYTDAPTLSEDASELLSEACNDPSGSVTCVDASQGLIVSTNKKGFAEKDNPRSQAKWRAVVRELVKLKLLECENGHDDVLLVTDAGYKAAERVRQLRETSLPKQPEAFHLTLAAEGTPPSQTIRVTASAPVEITRLEYMLSNETCIVGEDVSLSGKSVEIPLSHDLIRKVWNVPRSDRNNYDHSGPAKLAVTASVGGKIHQYVLPVQMESIVLSNTAYSKIVGSKTFHAA